MVKVHVFGLDNVVDRVDGMIERAEDWTQIAPEFHMFMLAREREFLDSSGQSEGERIEGYSMEPLYEAAKFAQTSDTTPLRWWGGEERLYPSLVDPSHPEHQFNVQSQAIEFGTRVPYAARIERGGTNQFGEPAPPRQVVTLGDSSTERLGDLMLAYIANDERDGADWQR